MRKIIKISRHLPGTTPPPPSSALIPPPPAYMTTTTMSTVSVLIICCLASTHVAAVVAAAAAAAGIIDARSLIMAMAIEQEGSKPSFNTLGWCDGAAQVDGLCCACCGSSGGGSGGGYSSLPTAKVDKKTTHQLTSIAGDREVSGRRRRRQIKRGGGPGGQESVVQGEAEVATQQPVRADIKAQLQDNRAEALTDRRWRHDVMRCNNQPWRMRDNHTREWEEHDRVQGLDAVAEGKTTIEGGKRAFKKGMVQG